MDLVITCANVNCKVGADLYQLSVLSLCCRMVCFVIFGTYELIIKNVIIGKTYMSYSN